MHVIIGGKDSFRQTLSDMLNSMLDENAYITTANSNSTLLVNAKMHPADVIILEDNLNDTSVLIDEIKQQFAETRIVLFSPCKKAEVKKADYVFPIKIQKNVPEELSEIILGKTAIKTEESIETKFISIYEKRDFEIFEGIMNRMTSEKMGEWLSASSRTIEGQRRILHRKTQTKDLVDLTLFGLKHKWLDRHRNLTSLFKELKANARKNK